MHKVAVQWTGKALPGAGFRIFTLLDRVLAFVVQTEFVNG